METKEYKKGKLSCQLWSGETGLPLLVVLDEPAYKARPEIFISEKFQEEHPCSVLWVQSEKDLTEWEQGRDLHTLLFELEQETDECRMYLVGGAAAWGPSVLVFPDALPAFWLLEGAGILISPEI